MYEAETEKIIEEAPDAKLYQYRHARTYADLAEFLERFPLLINQTVVVSLSEWRKRVVFEKIEAVAGLESDDVEEKEVEEDDGDEEDDEGKSAKKKSEKMQKRSGHREAGRKLYLMDFVKFALEKETN